MLEGRSSSRCSSPRLACVSDHGVAPDLLRICIKTQARAVRSSAMGATGSWSAAVAVSGPPGPKGPPKASVNRAYFGRIGH